MRGLSGIPKKALETNIELKQNKQIMNASGSGPVSHLTNLVEFEELTELVSMVKKLRLGSERNLNPGALGSKCKTPTELRHQSNVNSFISYIFAPLNKTRGSNTNDSNLAAVNNNYLDH